MEGRRISEEIRRIQEEVERFFRDFSPLRSTLFAERGRWHPFTDIIQTREGFLVRVELAGLEDDDFEVILDRDTLIIRGERREKGDGEKVAYHQMEISYGPFEILIPLEGSIREEGIKATYERGMLEVFLPLKKETPSHTPTRIKIR